MYINLIIKYKINLVAFYINYDIIFNILFSDVFNYG